ncbi:MAG: hypothetical protein A2908_04090 [Candidatus Staskawiczbacteria bacterium RIFCSPLOWO2_01_FULL_38_12b]|uniref:Uncharacterized protein n=1 Tax=Candidatus Staskawiczbacteria bacterium RIFCSPLOWO2_01_FULL_38_12b TaxID=1802214 RepID=A0A1G2IF88_9BACT|nr:MAG: hypothetical protein A2908_04090 [Candidatus Staskawiczbacteria bacterium RIFCSPLOWO2_01_FULL_38_12b]
MSTQTQAHKFAATILQNLPEVPEDIMQGWIENPKALQKLLAGLVPPVNGSITEFKVFKTIKLGTGPTNADGFRCHLKKDNIRIGDYANDIIGKPVFSVATEEIELDLVVVSVAELGFPKGAGLKDIYAVAKKRGLELCPNEVGPQLRLQYKDQPKNEWLIIGMEPIAGSGGALSVFGVEHNGYGFWLNTYYGYPDDVWSEHYRFVFVLPRK